MLTVGLALALPASAGVDHESMGGVDHGSIGKSQDKGNMSSMQRRGEKIREATVVGYKLEYYFMAMKEMMDGMKAMGMKAMGMKAMGMQMKDMDMGKMKSHHVMVFITRPDGKLVEDAKVGYKIDGPGGEQKTMAGPMMGGHGADADFKSKGAYKFTMKAVVGEKTLMDDFDYELT